MAMPTCRTWHLYRLKGIWKNCGPFSNVRKVPLQDPQRFHISDINPQLGIVSELKTPCWRGRSPGHWYRWQKGGAPKLTIGNTTAESAVRGNTNIPLMITLCLLPASQFSIMQQALDAQGTNLPHEPLVRDFIKGLVEVLKEYIDGSQKVTLTH